MRDIAAGPRVLLKRLRELMAEALEPQPRLDRIVREIASNMVAEVCSLYVLRADSVLELYATEGLNPGSVHLAQLKLGQDLPDKADVFVSELINIGMLAPNMIPVLQHARENLVKPGGKIIPAAAIVYGALIERRSWRGSIRCARSPALI